MQEADRNTSLRSARESMVLLKNDGVLPIAAKGKKIAVIGPHAGYARKMFGGYTHMCMMESTYAIANSIAGVSGVVQADADACRSSALLPLPQSAHLTDLSDDWS